MSVDTDRDEDKDSLPLSRRQGLSRLAEPHFLFPGIAILALLAIWLTTLQLVQAERDNADQAARGLVRELTETYEAQVVRILREIRQDLQLLQYASERHGMAEAMEALADRELLPPALLFSLVVIDPAGDVVASRGSTATVDPDAAFVQRHRENPNLQVATIHADGDTEELRLRFSRALRGPEGDFAGVGLVEVDADFFASNYESSTMGGHGMLGLLGPDGTFQVRRTGNRVSAGGQLDYAALMQHMDAFETRVIVMDSPVDGTARYLSARELFEFPLTVVVGLSREEQMAPAEQEVQFYMGRAAASSVLVLLIIGLLWRMSHKLARSRQREAEERIAHARQVEHLAFHDSLTDLPNRSLFSQLLGQSIAQAQRHNRKLAVLFLDLDHFKHINDTLGHDAGDRLLVEVSHRLKHCLRDSDTVARLGGDEFVVLLPEIAERSYAATVARKLITAINKPYILNGDEFRVTSSIGIATYPEDGLDEQTLTKNADVAMYKVKEEGKNNCQFYSDKIQSESLERQSLESSLRRALENDQFELHYQAKREMVSGQINGMEALLRWRHPELGLVAPLRFLPIAEETGLIIPLGKWVLRHVCEHNVQWQKEGYPRLGIAVNLTARQFFEDELASDVTAILEETGMEPDLLELEISEHVLMQNVDRALEVINSLKSIGVRVAIDNFGVGYSSLTMLKQFPLDSIKIDRTFIRDIADPADDKVLAQAIVTMGRTLGMTVVAQGVETEEQVNFLRDNACDEVQGFYFNKPMPLAEFKDLFPIPRGPTSPPQPEEDEPPPDTH